MVLYGQSAGANAVLTYSYAYPEKPIVAGFIASSGGTSGTNPATNGAFAKLAAQVGCGNLTAAAELACMQGVDAFVLQDRIQRSSSGLLDLGGFSAVVDNITVFANLIDRIQKGLVAKGVSSSSPGPGSGRRLTLPPPTAPDHRLHVQRNRRLPALRRQGHDAAHHPACAGCRVFGLRRAVRDGVS